MTETQQVVAYVPQADGHLLPFVAVIETDAETQRDADFYATLIVNEVRSRVEMTLAKLVPLVLAAVVAEASSGDLEATEEELN